MYSRVYELICKLHKNGNNLFPRKNPYGQISANSIPVTVYLQYISIQKYNSSLVYQRLKSCATEKHHT